MLECSGSSCESGVGGEVSIQPDVSGRKASLQLRLMTLVSHPGQWVQVARVQMPLREQGCCQVCRH